jgi:UDP-glucuronate decarboxylase
MKVLITGGAGFIGTNLCRYLLKNNNYVYCLDNLQCSSYDNIIDLIGLPNFKFIKHDITNSLLNINVNQIDQIYHLACPASPKNYQIDPLKTIKTCTIGTINVLDFALKKGARVLFTSTSEIYGDPEITPQTEEYRGNVNTLGIRSCYDEGKRISETIMMEYNRKYNIETRIVRIFNTYGPYLSPNDGRVVSNFIIQALNNKDLTIYGNGKQTRSFCYIDDLIDGLVKLMKSDYKYPINIGNPNEITIIELSNAIKELVNKDIKITYLDLPEDDPKRRKPDINKAKQILNWEPEVGLNEGLLKLINFYKNSLNL